MTKLSRTSDDHDPLCCNPTDPHEVCVRYEEHQPIQGHARVVVDRVDDLPLWARSRIAACREVERQYAVGDPPRVDAPSDAIKAWTERRALLAVLRILRGEAPA